MSLSFFSGEDLKAIAAKGISVQEVLRQLETFRQRSKACQVNRARTPGRRHCTDTSG